jgi:hypothetical protein
MTSGVSAGQPPQGTLGIAGLSSGIALVVMGCKDALTCRRFAD